MAGMGGVDMLDDMFFIRKIVYNFVWNFRNARTICILIFCNYIEMLSRPITDVLWSCFYSKTTCSYHDIQSN